ncbi:hypothetical protein QYF36_007137 [Acer negundo]|nr:hypothetical protein QYF36_007137 [Acer negundo]
MLGKEVGGCRSTSSDESERGLIEVYPKYRGETSKIGLGQVVGGNIIVDLGCGLTNNGYNGPTNDQAWNALNGSNRKEHVAGGLYCVLDGDNLSSSGNQISHVSATQFSNMAGEVTSKAWKGKVALGGKDG